MNKKSFALTIILCFVIAGSFAYAQQDPNDPGEPDVILFVPGPCSYFDTLLIPPNPSLWWDVEIEIHLCNDNPINGLVIPLVDTVYGSLDAYLDPAKNNPDSAFKDFAVEGFDLLAVDLTYHPPQVLYCASDSNDSAIYAGPIARMVYSVKGGGGTICLDSLSFPTGERLQLRRSDGIYYTPQVIASCFSTKTLPNCPMPDCWCPNEILGLEGDTITYEIWAEEIIFWLDIAEETACLSGLDSANYSLTLIYNMVSEAGWRVDIYPEDLEFGTYGVGFEVQTVCHTQGGCGTTVVYTKRGDADADGDVELSDAIFLANYLLKSGDAPLFSHLGDVNCNGGIAIDDVIYLANYLLKSGPEPCAEL
ncbi:MAG: hypothetical protein AMJ90_08710 [candidate division Zixibacteria bacterium SM23_73_2]|nr:MAG: hypothetical protein AMJ90_08710 [candidate division Zixibacteria bacterium SM23_73_2]